MDRMLRIGTIILLTSAFFACEERPKAADIPTRATKNASNMEDDPYEIDPADADPKARALMKEAFYWSPIEESGPFGSDDGWDTFFSFKKWRTGQRTTSPVVFLEQRLDEWNYPRFDLQELDETRLNALMKATRTGYMTLVGTDNAIIAIGFGQFVLEGRIDPDIQALTRTALHRELLPTMLALFGEDHRAPRTEQLKKMLSVVDRMNDPSL